MKDYSIILNRLKKNLKARKPLLKNNKITAYRLYEKDIPEYPYIVDIYNDQAVIYEKGKKLDESDTEQVLKHREHLLGLKNALIDILSLDEESIHVKARVRQKGKSQYEGANTSYEEQKFNAPEKFVVKENDFKFLVNLTHYLDTGLFLDHRPLREMIFKEASGKKVLNLFSYTGSISVAAALGGGKVTTVDMSNTYLDWAEANFRTNEIPVSDHKFTQADAVNYINNLNQKFDIIILDPPSFSNSKRMEDIFDVQRDHLDLIHELMKNLNPGGKLYFSNNFRKFKLDESLEHAFQVKDITLKSIPKDFRDLKIHVCFEIQHKE